MVDDEGGARCEEFSNHELTALSLGQQTVELGQDRRVGMTGKRGKGGRRDGGGIGN